MGCGGVFFLQTMEIQNSLPVSDTKPDTYSGSSILTAPEQPTTSSNLSASSFQPSSPTTTPNISFDMVSDSLPIHDTGPDTYTGSSMLNASEQPTTSSNLSASSSQPSLPTTTPNITYAMVSNSNNSKSSTSFNTNTSNLQTLEPYEPQIWHTYGSNEDRRSDLEWQKDTFSPTRHYPRFFHLTFPGTDIRNDLNVCQAEKELIDRVGKLSSISRFSNNTLLLEITYKNQTQSIKQLKEICGLPVVASLDPLLSRSRGLVTSKTMTHMKEEQLLEILKDQGVDKISRMKRHIGGSLQYTNSFILQFNSSTLPSLIKLNTWHFERVEQYIPTPMRCRKCQRLGHSTNQCRSSSPTCENCSQQGHSADTCTNPPLCINCEGKHRASCNSCPHYIFRKEILIEQTTSQLSFRQAKSKVRVSYAAQGKKYLFNITKETPTTKSPDTETTLSTSTPTLDQVESKDVSGVEESTRGEGETDEDCVTAAVSGNQHDPLSEQNSEPSRKDETKDKSLDLEGPSHSMQRTVITPKSPDPPVVVKKIGTRKTAAPTSTPDAARGRRKASQVSGLSLSKNPTTVKNSYKTLSSMDDMDQLIQANKRPREKSFSLERDPKRGSHSKTKTNTIKVVSTTRNKPETQYIDPSEY